MSVTTNKTQVTSASERDEPPILERGWTGFGRNYFHCLGTDPWSEVPQESQALGEGGPYSWGIDESEVTPFSENSDESSTTANPLLLAYRNTQEIPNKPKTKKDTKNNKKQLPLLADIAGTQIAPAACSSAASYFLSGTRHNRIVTLGTIHGRIMNPVLEDIQNKQQQLIRTQIRSIGAVFVFLDIQKQSELHCLRNGMTFWRKV